MIKSIKTKKKLPIEIDLTGPQGNVFYLLGLAKQFAKDLDLDGDEIIDAMTSSDYDNAVKVFDSWFGHFVTLYK